MDPIQNISQYKEQVLGQVRVPIDPDDTADSLAAKVLVQEHMLYPLILRRFAEGNRARIDLP